MKTLALVFVLSSAGRASAQPANGPTRIGTAVAVRGDTRDFHASSRIGAVLNAGDPVYLNDKIVTDNVGQVEIHLTDDTAFSIGPNSALVLDKYVYEPAAGTAEMLISVLNGVFRFISGKVAKSGPLNMKVNLPVCTIGIHGTEVAGDVDGDREANIYHLAGNPIDISNGYGARNAVKPGFTVNVKAKQAPGAPVPTPPAKKNSVLDAVPINRASQSKTTAPAVSTAASAALPILSAAGASNGAPGADLRASALDTLQRLAAEYSLKRRAAFMRLLSDDFLGNDEALEDALVQDFRNYSSVNLQIIPDKATLSEKGDKVSVLFRYNMALITNQGASRSFSGQAEYVFVRERGQARLYKMSAPIIFGNSLSAQQSPIAGSQGSATSNAGAGGTASSAPGAANGCGGTLQCGSGSIDTTSHSFNFPQGAETSYFGPTADVGLSGAPPDIVGAHFSTNKVGDIGPCDLNTLTTVSTPAGSVVTNASFFAGDCIVVTTNSPAGYFAVMKLLTKSSSSVTFNYIYQSNGTNRFH